MNKFFFILSFLLVILYIFINGLRNDPKIVPSALLNKSVPEFKIQKILSDSDTFSRNDIMKIQDVKLVNVFASWCLPCRIEHPQLKKLSKNIPIFGINKKDRKEDLKAWLSELGNPFYAIGADKDGNASIQWGVYGIPETFVLDKNSNIRYKHVGPILEKDLETINSIITSIKYE